MRQLYDQLDDKGNVVASGIKLIPGMVLPPNHSWVPHEEQLEAKKSEIKALIESRRNADTTKPVVVGGYTWQADAKSQELLSRTINLVTAGVAPVPEVWRTLDNQDIPATLDLLKSIAAAILDQTSNAYYKSWRLKEQLSLASSKEELNNIDWT
jgi:hypothetical protein